MSALNPDYDNDPERSRSFRTGWQEDVHAPVADRLIAEGTDSVLDVGCGIGRFATALGGRLDWIGLDASPRQIADCPYRPAILGDATRLALADHSVGGVTMLWMLYHLDQPRAAISEAKRVLRLGGLFAACTSSRRNDPELVPHGYPRTTFDAEEAGEIVADVFGVSNTEIERWDTPLVRLNNRDEVAAYARSHLLSAKTVQAVETPLTLTKRGCLVWARHTD
jgi:SAM-dependent methyltransferase